MFPTSRTELYIEIVLFVLGIYEQKQGLQSENEDLLSVYNKDLLYLGRMALESLQTESCILKNINHAVAVSSYPTSDSFHFSLLQARGESVRVTHFFIRAFKNSFLVSFLLAKLLKEKLAASQ